MRGQPEHDQIGVGAPDAVVRVGVVRGRVPLFPDVVDDFVLALSRHRSVREDYVQIMPSRILV